MATTITTVTGSTHGESSNSRRLARTNVNGVRWTVCLDPSVPRLEFHWSDDGVSWQELTSARINSPGIAAGASMRVIGGGGAGEAIICAYREADGDMRVAFGFMAGDRRSFKWASQSPQLVSKTGGSGDYRYPDVTGYYNGRNWVMPVVWGDLNSKGRSIPWFGTAVYASGDLRAFEERRMATLYSMTAWPRPSVELRHLFDLRAVNRDEPDAYAGWAQGADVDTGDRQQMLRHTKSSGDSWQAGTRRTVRQDGAANGLTATCYTGERFAMAAVDAGDTDHIVLHLMGNEDRYRDVVDVPALGHGEVTALSVTWDNWTHDVYVLAAGTSNRRPHVIRYDWSTREWAATWDEVDTDDVMPHSLTTKPGSIYKSIEARWVRDNGNGTMSYRYAEVLATNVAPDAPTWQTASGAHDVSQALTLVHDHNDADGDPQVQVRYRRQLDDGAVQYWNGGAWQSSQVELSTGSDTLVLPAGWDADANVVHYRVATNDGVEWSPYSEALSVVAAQPLSVSIVSPADGAALTVPAVTVEWDTYVPTVRIRVFDTNTGALLHTTGWRAVSGTALTLDYEPANGDALTVELAGQSDEGLTSPADTHDVTVALTPPPTPTATLSLDTTLATIDVTVDNGTPGGGEDAAAVNSIDRRPVGASDDEWLTVSEWGVEPDGVFVDDTWPAGVDLEYRVRAQTALGAVAAGPAAS